MKPSPVVNSSPLIALAAALPDFDLLGKIVERFIIPGEVIEELDAGGLRDSTADLVRRAAWCEIRPKLASADSGLVQRLGTGEAAVITTALADRLPLVVIDEVRGRRAARLAGLRVTGSLGILLELHRASLLPSIKDSLKRMQEKGIHLAEHLIEQTLRAASLIARQSAE